MSEPRIIWVRDILKSGKTTLGLMMLRQMRQVPEYDWDLLRPILASLLLTGLPTDESTIIREFGRLLAIGPRRIEGGYAGIRMPLKD